MSTRRTRRQQRPRYTIDETLEDPIDDDKEDTGSGAEEVTRCVCGSDELEIPDDAGDEFDDVDTGFFIQCESCSVWQHGYCVGINDESVAPEKYWCEQCRPDMHSLFVDKFGIQRSKYDPSAAEPRKGRKRKSRSSSANGKEKKVKEVKEEEEAEEDDATATRRTMNSSRDYDYETMLKKVLEESARESGVQPEEAVLSSSETPYRKTRSYLRRRGQSGEESGAEQVSGTEQAAPPSTAEESGTDVNAKETAAKVPTPQKRKRKRKRAPAKQETKFGDDKPFKANIPSGRISLNEMRRRVFSIMEFISNIQVELAQEEEAKNSLLRLREEDKSGELDKPENVALKNGLISCYNASVTQLDQLTKKLNEWGTKYR